jgi:hypothetical protein
MFSHSTFNCQGDKLWRRNHTIESGWEGNPVFESSYATFYESLKKAHGKSGESSHSLAMLPTHLEKIKAWIESNASTIPVAKILFWYAFSSLGFTLWTRYVDAVNHERCRLTVSDRNEELCNLTWAMVETDDVDPNDGTPYHQYTLTFRKTNQDDPDKCECD